MCKNGHKKRAEALCPGFNLVLLISVFNYRYHFIEVSRYAATAVVDTIFYGNLHIKHIINQFKVCDLAINRLDARSPADQISNLVGVQLLAHQRFKGNDISGLFIRPPWSCRRGVLRYAL